MSPLSGPLSSIFCPPSNPSHSCRLPVLSLLSPSRRLVAPRLPPVSCFSSASFLPYPLALTYPPMFSMFSTRLSTCVLRSTAYPFTRGCSDELIHGWRRCTGQTELPVQCIFAILGSVRLWYRSTVPAFLVFVCCLCLSSCFRAFPHASCMPGACLLQHQVATGCCCCCSIAGPYSHRLLFSMKGSCPGRKRHSLCCRAIVICTVHKTLGR